MLNFTLSKNQEAFRDYAHQVAVEEMRPISLECDRNEQIPESFFWNMQKRFWGGSAARARMEGEAGQANILSMLSQEEMAWGDAALATAIPGPGLAALLFSRKVHSSSRGNFSASTWMGNSTGEH